jgi:hypothetical protein
MNSIFHLHYINELSLLFWNSKGGHGGTKSSPETPERVFITFPENPSKTDNLVVDPRNSKLIYNKSTRINRLEVRAALDMSVNILPFWLCTFPVSCYAMALYWCVRLEGDCHTVFLTWTYMWDLFLLHSIYNPIMYMSTSSEFRRALFHIVRKCINIFHFWNALSFPRSFDTKSKKCLTYITCDGCYLFRETFLRERPRVITFKLDLIVKSPMEFLSVP